MKRALVLTGLFLAVGSVQAESTRYRATGVVEYNFGFEPVKIGDTFDYQFTIDDQGAFNDHDRYFAISNINAQIGSFSGINPGTNELISNPSGLYASEVGVVGNLWSIDMAFQPEAPFADGSIANSKDLDTKPWSLKGLGGTVFAGIGQGFASFGGTIKSLARQWANGWGIGKEPPPVSLPGLPEIGGGPRC